jgi:WD40 repeat protein
MFHGEGEGSTYFRSESPTKQELERWSPKVQVFDLATGRRSAQWIEPVNGVSRGEIYTAGAMDLSRDGRRVAVTSGFFPGHLPRIIDLDRGDVLELHGHEGAVVAVAFGPDSRRVATASADRTTRIWDARNGHELKRLGGHAGKVVFVAFSPDGQRLLTLAAISSSEMPRFPLPPEVVDGRLWDVETGAELTPLRWPKGNDGSDQIGCPRLARFSLSSNEVYTVGLTQGLILGTEPMHPAVWDATRGKLLRSLRREERTRPQAGDVAVSADGRKIAIGYSDGEVRVLDPASGSLIRALHGHTGWVKAVAFTPDGRRLVSTAQDGTARVWDVRTDHQAEFQRGRWAGVVSMAFSPDGRRVALERNAEDKSSAGATPSGDIRNGFHTRSDHVIEVRDVADGRVVVTTPICNHEGERPPRFSPDGRIILAGADARALGENPFPGAVNHLFDTESGRLLRTLGTPKPHVLCLAACFSPDGQTVATVTTRDGLTFGDLNLYETSTGNERLHIAMDAGPRWVRHLVDIRFSPDGTRLLTVSGSPSVFLWDARDGRRVAEFKDAERGIERVDRAIFSPDSRHILMTLVFGRIVIRDVPSGREVLVLSGHGGPVNSVEFSPDGTRFLTASTDGTARIWNTADGRELTRITGLENQSGKATFSPDARVVLIFGQGMSARLWDGRTGRPICTLARHDLGFHSAAFSPDGGLVALSFIGEPHLTRAWPVNFLATARAQCPRELTPAERARFELPAP